jgi:hypothetical protein
MWWLSCPGATADFAELVGLRPKPRGTMLDYDMPVM